MSIIVQKYGGSSVADGARLLAVAKRIVETKRRGYQVVVVVSAMGKTTDRLLEQAHEISANPGRRELDMLLSVGERISISLLSMAINDLGQTAISFTGSQSGIITDSSHVNARILEIRPHRIFEALAEDKIVIVAGYQGMSVEREITTLGRGGTDTTAVALTAALGADYCEICSDVDGVYTGDPRVIADVSRIDHLSHDEMLELAHGGAKVLALRAVEYARKEGITIHAASTFSHSGFTKISTTASPFHPPAVAADSHLVMFQLLSSGPSSLIVFQKFLDALSMDIRWSNTTSDPESSDNGAKKQLRQRVWFRSENIPDLDLIVEDALKQWGGLFTADHSYGSVTVVADGIGRRGGRFAVLMEELVYRQIEWLEIHQAHNTLTFIVSREILDRAQVVIHTALNGSII